MIYKNGALAIVTDGFVSGKPHISDSISFEYNITYPIIRDNRAISAFYARSAKREEARINDIDVGALRKMPKGITGQYITEIKYQVTYNENGLLSIINDTYEAMGPYKNSNRRTAICWDLQSGVVVPLARLVKNPYEMERLILREVNKAIEGWQSESPGSFFMELGREQRDWQWYLCERGIMVFYGREIIAPHIGGIPSFLLTWGQIGAHLR